MGYDPSVTQERHWNALPLELRQSTSLSNLKTKLEKYFLSNHTPESLFPF